MVAQLQLYRDDDGGLAPSVRREERQGINSNRTIESYCWRGPPLTDDTSINSAASSAAYKTRYTETESKGDERRHQPIHSVTQANLTRKALYPGHAARNPEVHIRGRMPCFFQPPAHLLTFTTMIWAPAREAIGPSHDRIGSSSGCATQAPLQLVSASLDAIKR